jgi:hypothetical protein
MQRSPWEHLFGAAEFEGVQMLRRSMFIAFAAGPLLPVTALAHHSRAAYDMTSEIVIAGTVTELQWKNPHIFMTVATAASAVEVEVTSVSEAQALGLTREAIAPGARVTVRAHPGRNGQGTRAVGLDVRTSDGTVYPLNTDAKLALRRATVPANGMEGHWSPTLESFNSLLANVTSLPLTDSAVAAFQTAARDVDPTSVAALGICEPFPPPVLSVFPDLRTIDVRDATITLRFEGGVGVPMERVVYLDREHPADVAPSLMGHSIGYWEGDTLVIDTVGFAPHSVGGLFLPSGPDKHLVERLTLAPDRLHLQYAFTLRDPATLTEPVTMTAAWEHRPDLEFSGEACDPDVARRALRE